LTLKEQRMLTDKESTCELNSLSLRYEMSNGERTKHAAASREGGG
jgi:hypothetical protein